MGLESHQPTPSLVLLQESLVFAMGDIGVSPE